MFWITKDGQYCKNDSGQLMSWSEVYRDIDQFQKYDFGLRIEEDVPEEDLLQRIVNFCLCVWIHIDNTKRKFLLNIECSSEVEVKSKIVNRFTQFLIPILRSGCLKLKINGRVFENSRLADFIPRRFFPVIIIDEKRYDFWFNKVIEKDSWIRAGEMSDYTTLGMLAIRTCRTFLSNQQNTSTPVKERLEKIFDQYFQNSNLFTIYLVCCLYSQLRKKGVKITQEEKTNQLLKEVCEIAMVYSLGVKEVIENIIRHTSSKKGLIYIRQLRRENISTSCYRETKENILYQPEVENWMEIKVVDAGEKGILQTANTMESLYNIYHWSDKDLQLDLDSINDLVFHKGLKIFSRQIRLSGGIFLVKTADGKKGKLYLESDSLPYLKDYDQSLGTDYTIWLPMQLNAYSHANFIWESDDSRIDDFRSLPIEIREDRRENLFKTSLSIFLEKIETTDQFVAGIIKQCREISKKIEENRREYYYFNFANLGKDQSLKLLYYIGAYRLISTVPFLVVYNLRDDIVKAFQHDYCPLLLEYAGISQVSKAGFLFLYNIEGTPVYVTNDFQVERSREMSAYACECRGILQPPFDSGKIYTENSLIRDEEREALHAPVEIVCSDEKNEFSAPLFQLHLQQLFSRDIEDDEKFGLRFQGHINLTNRIHLGNYYQGELLFDNSYYQRNLAYILAKRLRTHRNMILVGNKRYSNGLIEQLKMFLGRDRVAGTMIYEREKTIFNPEEITNLEKPEFVIIVPISSTMRNFAVIERYIRSKYDEVTNKNLTFSYYTFFLCRDKLREDELVSENERAFLWEKFEKNSVVVNRNKPLSNWGNQQIIYFFMQLEGEWRDACSCDLCTYKENAHALIRTADESLILDTKLGLPYNKIGKKALSWVNCYSSRFEDDARHRLYEDICACVLESHFVRADNHFKYYMFTDKFLQKMICGSAKTKPEFDAWIIWLRAQLHGKNDCQTILLVPDHDDNYFWGEFICKKVFGDHIRMISENFSDEFYSNFKKKYSFLWNDNRKKRYVFIDDCINTGHAWNKIYSLLTLRKEELDQAQQDEFIVIALLDRMDIQNKQALKGKVTCYFYTEIFIPTIKEQNGSCWLCLEKEKQIELARYTYSDPAASYYRKKIEKLRLIPIYKEKEIDFEKIKLEKKNSNVNFLVTNEIYKQLFEHYEELQYEDFDKLREFLGIEKNYCLKTNIIFGCKASVQYKIAFVKSLSRPFLNHFSILRTLCVRVCMAEFNKLLKEGKGENNSDDIKLMIVLLKRFALLDVAIILKKQTFDMVSIFLRKRLDSSIGKKKDSYYTVERFALQYAVAVKKLIFQSETNTLIWLNEFKDFLPWKDKYQTAFGQNGVEEKLLIQFVNTVFASHDLIIEKAIENYQIDRELFLQKDGENSYLLNNTDYMFFEREMKILEPCAIPANILRSMSEYVYDIFPKKKEEKMEALGLGRLFQKIVLNEGEELPAVYFYKEDYYKDVQNGSFETKRYFDIRLLPYGPIKNGKGYKGSYEGCWKDMYNQGLHHGYVEVPLNINCGFQLTPISHECSLLNFSFWDSAHLSGLMFVGKFTKKKYGLALIFYRFLCSIAPKIFHDILNKANTEAPVFVNHASDEELKEEKERRGIK